MLRLLRKQLKLYYAILLALVGVVLLLKEGFLFQFLWPDRPEVNNIVVPHLYLLTFYTVVFTEKLFDLKKLAPVLYRWYQAMYISFPLVNYSRL